MTLSREGRTRQKLAPGFLASEAEVVPAAGEREGEVFYTQSRCTSNSKSLGTDIPGETLLTYPLVPLKITAHATCQVSRTEQVLRTSELMERRSLGRRKEATPLCPAAGLGKRKSTGSELRRLSGTAPLAAVILFKRLLHPGSTELCW